MLIWIDPLLLLYPCCTYVKSIISVRRQVVQHGHVCQHSKIVMLTPHTTSLPDALRSVKTYMPPFAVRAAESVSYEAFRRAADLVQTRAFHMSADNWITGAHQVMVVHICSAWSQTALAPRLTHLFTCLDTLLFVLMTLQRPACSSAHARACTSLAPPHSFILVTHYGCRNPLMSST